MGKEQDLLQAVKSGDLLSTQKLLSKLKSNRNMSKKRGPLRAPGGQQEVRLYQADNLSPVTGLPGVISDL
eukprot:superscaffoldBa00007003_g22135